MALIIDEEFAALIPPLTKEEFQRLEKNCLSDGIRDALITWDGTLIDGHNRLKIAMEHNLPFDEVEMYFPDKEAAKLWIIDNQLGKRNLVPYDKVILQDKKRHILAKQAKEKRIEGNAKGGKSDKKSCPTSQTRQEKRENSTDYKIAKAADTSEDTVRKVRAIDNSGDKELIRQVREGETTINRAYQVVKGIEPIKTKSPAEMKREHLETAKKEHEAFAEQKVVTIEDIAKDKSNRKTLAKEQYQKLLNIGKAIEDISIRIEAGDVDLKAMSKELSYDERKLLLDMIGIWRGQLTKIAEGVIGN